MILAVTICCQGVTSCCPDVTSCCQVVTICYQCRLDGEKLSQASVLFDAGNYIKRVTRESADLAAEIQAVKNEMDELNSQIE